MLKTVLSGIGLICLLGLGFVPLNAQEGQCAVADTINYPVDTNQFRLAQDFGVASPRHQGRRHTGEDWFIGPRASLGQPVSAIANGRVTFSSPTGWGRDGGVVIIEHVFTDGTTLYSQYGHMMETDTIKFPQRLNCVEAGQIIGAVGDVRPAPHLHFEIRVNQPDIPGPGYLRGDPVREGWRHPAEVITNMQARLGRGYEWSVTTGVDSPPLLLNDNSMMVASRNTLRRITSDGRILWRVFLNGEVIGFGGFQASPLLFYSDGQVARMDFDGAQVETWQIDFMPDQAPIEVGDALVFHTSDNALVALSANRREVLWWLEDIPAFDHATVSGQLIALATNDHLWLVTHSGQLVDEARLDAGVSFATRVDGSLVAYTEGGLWQIDGTGKWSQLLDETIPGSSASGGVTLATDGRYFLLDGTRLHSYSRTGSLIWQADLPVMLTGRTEMRMIENLVLMTNTDGTILVARGGGGFCGITRIYGGVDSRLWYDLAEDGILRVLVGQQFIGLDWQEFNLGC